VYDCVAAGIMMNATTEIFDADFDKRKFSPIQASKDRSSSKVRDTDEP
jgi:hypothetical protein